MDVDLTGRNPYIRHDRLQSAGAELVVAPAAGPGQVDAETVDPSKTPSTPRASSPAARFWRRLPTVPRNETVPIPSANTAIVRGSRIRGSRSRADRMSSSIRAFLSTDSLLIIGIHGGHRTSTGRHVREPFLARGIPDDYGGNDCQICGCDVRSRRPRFPHERRRRGGPPPQPGD